MASELAAPAETAPPAPWQIAGWTAGLLGIDDVPAVMALGYLLNAGVIDNPGTQAATPRDAAVLLTVIMAADRPVDAVAYAVAYAELRNSEGVLLFDALASAIDRARRFSATFNGAAVPGHIPGIPQGFEVCRSLDYPMAAIGRTAALGAECPEIAPQRFGAASPSGMRVTAYAPPEVIAGLGTALANRFPVATTPPRSPLIEKLFG